METGRIQPQNKDIRSAFLFKNTGHIIIISTNNDNNNDNDNDDDDNNNNDITLL